MTDPETFFASPDRTSVEEIASKARALDAACLSLDVLDCAPTPMMVLDENRQIVVVNRAMIEMLGELGLTPTLGVRPGEALGCVYATEMPAGCGTSEHCGECGACQAIVQAQQGERCRRDCRLLFRIGEALQAAELEVTASPLEVNGVPYTILALLDVSHHKRREALERIFFHDLMNTAWVVSGYASLLGSLDGERAKGGLERIVLASQRIIEEIQIQRDLVSAERGDLHPVLETIDAEEALLTVAADYRTSPLAQGMTLETVPSPSVPGLTTDPLLLMRVLSNMVKNALEASQEGGTVRMGVCERDSGVQFWVHNPGVIPHNLQLVIFQRSFSTKGRNRGLGTFSMKMLAENYLAGRIWFDSNAEEGTTFRLWLPLSAQADPPAGEPGPRL